MRANGPRAARARGWLKRALRPDARERLQLVERALVEELEQLALEHAAHLAVEPRDVLPATASAGGALASAPASSAGGESGAPRPSRPASP